MKAAFATWTALLGILTVMAVWIWTHGFGVDPAPFILLNLCLSCLAALQCFILLIAAKRADQSHPNWPATTTKQINVSRR